MATTTIELDLLTRDHFDLARKLYDGLPSGRIGKDIRAQLQSEYPQANIRASKWREKMFELPKRHPGYTGFVEKKQVWEVKFELECTQVAAFYKMYRLFLTNMNDRGWAVFNKRLEPGSAKSVTTTSFRYGALKYYLEVERCWNGKGDLTTRLQRDEDAREVERKLSNIVFDEKCDMKEANLVTRTQQPGHYILLLHPGYYGPRRHLNLIQTQLLQKLRERLEPPSRAPTRNLVLRALAPTRQAGRAQSLKLILSDMTSIITVSTSEPQIVTLPIIFGMLSLREVDKVYDLHWRAREMGGTPFLKHIREQVQRQYPQASIGITARTPLENRHDKPEMLVADNIACSANTQRVTLRLEVTQVAAPKVHELFKNYPDTQNWNVFNRRHPKELVQLEPENFYRYGGVKIYIALKDQWGQRTDEAAKVERGQYAQRVEIALSNIVFDKKKPMNEASLAKRRVRNGHFELLLHAGAYDREVYRQLVHHHLEARVNERLQSRGLKQKLVRVELRLERGVMMYLKDEEMISWEKKAAQAIEVKRREAAAARHTAIHSAAGGSGPRLVAVWGSQQ